jgi:hypothetical protein
MYVCVYACSLLLVTVVMVTEEESERNFLYIEEKDLLFVMYVFSLRLSIMLTELSRKKEKSNIELSIIC